MKQITIGDINLKDLTPQHLLQLAEIEGVHLHFEFWDKIEMIDFSNKMFSDTLVVDFFQKKIENSEINGRAIVFFFHFEDFSFHWHFKDNHHKTEERKRLSLKSIKFLIESGYHLPLY